MPACHFSFIVLTLCLIEVLVLICASSKLMASSFLSTCLQLTLLLENPLSAWCKAKGGKKPLRRESLGQLKSVRHYHKNKNF